jgi:hypothetical protein
VRVERHLLNGGTYSLDAFPHEAGDDKQDVPHDGLPHVDVDALACSDDVKALIREGGKKPSRSEAVWRVTCELLRCGTDQLLILAVLLDAKLGISEHVLEQGNPRTYAWRQIEKAKAKVEEPRIDVGGRPLSVQDWIDCDVPPLDRLLGELMTTTARIMVVGPTGLGKTMFGLAAAFAMGHGRNFLHWRSHRQARVLYVDGEMSRRVMKKRVADTLRRSGEKTIPAGVVILNRDMFPEIPPLNTPAGQAWLNKFIDEHGPFDFVIFDNIQALLVGDVKDNEQWANVLPYVRSLTHRSIGQMWFHHTGFDESRSYGDKSREWQLDTVVLMKREKDTADDIAFRLEFIKARERDSDNRSDFDEVLIGLRGDKWVHGAAPKKEKEPKKKKLNPSAEAMFAILKLKAGERGLTKEEWNEACREEGLTPKRRADLLTWREALRNAGLVNEHDGRWNVIFGGEDE